MRVPLSVLRLTGTLFSVQAHQDREWSNASNLFQLFPQASGKNA